MSKRILKKYLTELPKEALEEQVLDLYERFAPVKTYYDFVFNPKEDKILHEAKSKIHNEYFPLKRRKPRARRSVAQKYIRHFRTLGMQEVLIADLMWYNLETAQQFSASRNVPTAFYRSMLNSFTEAVQFTVHESLIAEFRTRMEKVYAEVFRQQWLLAAEFERVWETT
ncbi:MAG: hypothetical protein HKN89_10760, partial [Eudoraea sp.]|nr:hypothetical protein [Eudoraea sp.]